MFFSALGACLLPSVSQPPEPVANAATSESTPAAPAASAAMDASMSAARDAADATQAVSNEPAAADAGASSGEPASSSEGRNAASGGRGTMHAAGQGGGEVRGGAQADPPRAGKGGAVSPALPAALGAKCRSAEECASGHCADGVCCNAACEGECEQCNVLRQEGRCVLLDGEPDFDSCPDSTNICVRGVCARVKGNGSDCTMDDECGSSVCDFPGSGFCCAIRCPVCHACAAGGEECAPSNGRSCGGNNVCVNGDCQAQ